MELLEHLPPLLKAFWFVAIPTSLVFIVQTIMTFLGADAADGIDADFNGDFNGEDAPFQLFSFRNLINFLLGFSWSGISFYSTISNTLLLVALSVMVGVFFVALFFIIIQQVQKLAEDNSFKLSDTLQKSGEVYLTVPAQKTGTGKIMVSVNGSVHELSAITEDDHSIPTGAVVKIVRIAHDNLLVVEKI